MRLKIFSLFVATQLISLGIFNALHAGAYEAAPIENTAVHAASDEVASHVRFAAQDVNNEYHTISYADEDFAKQVMANLPQRHYGTLKNLIIDNDPKARRGLGGRSMIILRGVNMGKAETAAVLVHEIGHVTDLGYLSGTKASGVSEFNDGKFNIYNDDLSLRFYRISWETEKKLKKTSSNLDFVSGYAMSDPFEDFAETYAFYILHNAKFRQLASTNDALATKYHFMKNFVFNGEVFDDHSVAKVNENRRPWDITVLGYNFDEFIKL